MLEQTPLHDHHNPDLLRILPADIQRVIEIGCSSGALAREFRKVSPAVHWVGVEVDPEYARAASRHCDQTVVANIERCAEEFFLQHQDRDCWIFGDVLEHLVDPWATLRSIRKVLPPGGMVAACIPNAQHWSVVMRLVTGRFRYEGSGLLDRTHLRWFTRDTIHELFRDAGFRIVQEISRTFNEKQRERFLPLLLELNKACGVDPLTAASRLTPLQYVVRAVPV